MVCMIQGLRSGQNPCMHVIKIGTLSVLVCVARRIKLPKQHTTAAGNTGADPQERSCVCVYLPTSGDGAAQSKLSTVVRSQATPPRRRALSLRALVRCRSSPPHLCGLCSGYATFSDLLPSLEDNQGSTPVSWNACKSLKLIKHYQLGYDSYAGAGDEVARSLSSLRRRLCVA